MEKVSQFKLIDGVFSPEDAREILFVLINSKINFHQMEKFIITEKTSGDVSYSENRILQLKAVHQSIKELLEQSKIDGKQLQINGSIEINYVD